LNKIQRLLSIAEKQERYVVGLMSGTSVDGIDAALVKISGVGVNTKVKLVEFENTSFSEGMRKKIFELFNPSTSTVDKICHMNFLLGEIFAEAVVKVIKKAGMSCEEVDLIGSHGQTIYHIPGSINDSGFNIKSTLQIGEPSVIAERTGILTIGDFRVRDMAAGGQGAPLVPYVDYLLYRSQSKTIGLQNIGGIANITLLPAGSGLKEVVAFDNGPGNMVIDEVVFRITEGTQRYDKDGLIARKGRISEELLELLMEDEYFKKKYPKTTGREYFGAQYVDKVIFEAGKRNIKDEDLVATVTAFTAKAITDSYKQFIIPKYGLDEVIIGGGGSYNPVLLEKIREYLPEVDVLIQEDLGFSSDAKEAVAFAVLANEVLNGNCTNMPSVTGAEKEVILGKIVL
jgi:anhydro-N-acetylmuramic acid kinase